jgi:hypothetical protein
VASLKGDSFVSEFIGALTHEHPGISKEASRALAGRAGPIMGQLRSLFPSQSQPHVRKHLFKLLTAQPFWARGIFLLEALRDRDDYIVELGRRTLRDWLVQSRGMATAPNKDELQQLRAALKASAGVLASHEARELEFCLRTYE